MVAALDAVIPARLVNAALLGFEYACDGVDDPAQPYAPVVPLNVHQHDVGVVPFAWIGVMAWPFRMELVPSPVSAMLVCWNA